MSSRAALRKASERRPHKPQTVPPRRSWALLAWLAGSFVLVLGIVFGLMLADVRMGQGYFWLRYSPVADWRLDRTLPLLVVGAVACASVLILTQPQQMPRKVGLLMLALALLGAGAWIAWAPPEPLNQHTFNMHSFSTDGAFAFEASKFHSLPAYLEDFPHGTLQRTAHQMGGTRVLSNPPGATVLAWLARRGLAGSENPGVFERMLMEAHEVELRAAREAVAALGFGVILWAMWVLSGWAGYLLGRVFLSPAGAAVFAVIVTFNPCTVHFIPGKDPGQLLTINLMLWAWFAAWQRKCLGLAALGGAVLTIGSTLSLVHIWIALIALIATLWHARTDRSFRTVIANATSAAAGGVAVCLLLYVALSWNVPLTLWAVSDRWTQLQQTFNMNRAIWYAIGLPIFLLFLSPGFWALLGLTIRRPRLGLGGKLALCTAAVMLVIYGPLGLTYELPRLWVGFVPPLVLGLAVDQPLLACRSSSARAAKALALVVAMQVAFTGLHWTIFDARESEYRLTTGRGFG